MKPRRDAETVGPIVCDDTLLQAIDRVRNQGSLEPT